MCNGTSFYRRDFALLQRPDACPHPLRLCAHRPVTTSLFSSLQNSVAVILDEAISLKTTSRRPCFFVDTLRASCYLQRMQTFSAPRFRVMNEFLGLKVLDLAKTLGVSPITIIRIRNGKTEPHPTLQKLMELFWPQWWPFLTQQTNTIPNPEPVRTEEG